MQTFTFHINGIKGTFQELAKGHFLIYFLPGIILTILYYLFTAYTSSVQGSIQLSSDYSWIDWTFGLVNSGINTVFSVFSMIVDQVYIFAILTLLSPFNTALGEKLDSQLTGKEYKFSTVGFINDFFRMLFVVTLLMLMEFALILAYWVISWFIPDAIDSIVYFTISAFFFGFSFYDFGLERDKIGVFGTIAFGFSNPLTMLLTGSIFLAIYAIPIIGIPISPVLAVMISTYVYLYMTKKLPTINTELQTQTNE